MKLLAGFSHRQEKCSWLPQDLSPFLSMKFDLLPDLHALARIDSASLSWTPTNIYQGENVINYIPTCNFFLHFFSRLFDHGISIRGPKLSTYLRLINHRFTGFIILLDLLDLGKGGPTQRGGYLALALCVAFRTTSLKEQILVVFHYEAYTM